MAKHGNSMWLCRCSCGQTKVISRSNLISGTTKSCGCLNDETRVARLTKHNMARTRLYHIWHGMKQRCTNPKDHDYSRYGGRGITICAEWMHFEAFKEWASANGYRDDLTIDRINVHGNYDPTNCRWATVKEQNSNKSNARLLTYNGKTQSITAWAEELGIDRHRIFQRLQQGWNTERALTESLHQTGRK